MPIQVALNHKTTYHYDRLVTLLPQVVRLRPAPHCRTPILSYSLRVEPQPHFLNWQQDPYSNYLARLVFPKPARELRVEVDLVAEMTAINPFDFFIEEAAEKYPFTYDADPGPRADPLPGNGAGRARGCRPWSSELRRRDIRTVDYLVELNRRLHEKIRYVIRMEPGVQTCEETLTLGSGSCRDSAWLLVQLLRHLGLAARFVSGYLIQLTADVKPLDGPSGTGQRLHRPARLGRGLSARGRLDRPRPDLGPARRRGPHPAGLRRRPDHRRARSPARFAGRRTRARTSTTAARRRSSFTCRCTRIHEDAARHQAVHRGAVAGDRRSSATQIDERPARRRRPADDGRRADLRLDRRPRRRRNGTRPPWATTSAGWPASCCSGCAIASPRAACCTTARANGIPANRCRAGPSAATGGATACPSGTNPDLIADDEPRLRPRPRPTPSASSRRWRNGWASIPQLRHARPTRTSGTTSGASGSLPVNVDPLQEQSRRPRGAAPAGAGSSSRA